jgi:hypothetical protein
VAQIGRTRLSDEPAVAQLPPIGGLMSFLSLIQLLGSLLTSGRTTVQAIRSFAHREGATDEELAAVDAQLSAELARRASV